MPMTERHLVTLEFDKIRTLLRQHAGFSASEALAETLSPTTDLSDLTRRQNATEEARRLLEIRPNSGVRGARDVRPLAQRAAIGGILNASELLEIAGTIGTGRSMRGLLQRQELRVPTLAAYA